VLFLLLFLCFLSLKSCSCSPEVVAGRKAVKGEKGQEGTFEKRLAFLFAAYGTFEKLCAHKGRNFGGKGIKRREKKGKRKKKLQKANTQRMQLQ